jgi:hypothetical protein
MRTRRFEYWIIGACVAAALALRLYRLARPGYLLGVTEYDDGVLFGNAVRLAGGAVPYRDFAMEQPPGSLLLLAPVALLAKVTGTAAGLAVARVLTVAADCGCVVLLGLLVRHRGPLAVAVACGCYAVYPAALVAAHTFLLEPWLNLCCLGGAVLFFDGDALTTRPRCTGAAIAPRGLAWGGALFGFAVAIKLWALFPLAVAGLLLARRPRRAWATTRPRGLLIAGAGAAAGLAVPVLPFLAVAPGGLYTGAVASQFVRSSGPHTLLPRLASIAGLPATLNARTTAVLLLALAASCALAYLAAFAISRLGPTALDWYALLGLAAVLIMFCLPQGYYPHYAAFAGPFAALVAAGPPGLIRPKAPAAAFIGLAVAAAVTIMGLTQFSQAARLTGETPAATADRLIPAGACVVTDDPSLTIAADRFDSGVPDCPAVVDSFGALMTMTGGHNMGASPHVLDAVAAAWRGWFGHAEFVWLLWGSQGRIPWTPSLYAWFTSHFRLVALASTVPPGHHVPRGGLYARMPYDQQNDGHVAYQPVSARRSRR